jgi:hypothetical protein
LPDAFTDYKYVTKSLNRTVNAPERVEVPKKTTQAPSVVKRGRVAQTKKDKTTNKRAKKEKMMPLQKTVDVSQPMVDTLWIFHNLALKRAIETRMLARRKAMMLSY